MPPHPTTLGLCAQPEREAPTTRPHKTRPGPGFVHLRAGGGARFGTRPQNLFDRVFNFIFFLELKNDRYISHKTLVSGFSPRNGKIRERGVLNCTWQRQAGVKQRLPRRRASPPLLTRTHLAPGRCDSSGLWELWSLQALLWRCDPTGRAFTYVNRLSSLLKVERPSREIHLSTDVTSTSIPN